MAMTVNNAFTEFLGKSVNLDADVTQTARRSRDWLVSQIEVLAEANGRIPPLYSEEHIYYGSFARRTKIRPLDDVDVMVCLKAQGCTYLDVMAEVHMTVPSTASDFKALTFDDGITLSSRKVINSFVTDLNGVPKYQQAAIKRNGEAATLKLVSREWAFDVTPCFRTANETSGRSYYLIPNGNGHWKRTDPRLDRDRVKRINQAHQGRVLNVVRLAKYWNARRTAPRMASYLLEALVLDYYDGGTQAVRHPGIEFVSVLMHTATAVMGSVADPKGIDTDINDLDHEQRVSISRRATEDARACLNALNREREGEQDHAIRLWRQVFGDAFPPHG